VSLYVTAHDTLALLTVTASVWSNFEIGDLDFWRGEAYSKFFDYLDEQGGFYYEVSLVFVCQDRSSPRIAMGRCTGSQHRRRIVRDQGSDSLLQ